MGGVGLSAEHTAATLTCERDVRFTLRERVVLESSFRISHFCGVIENHHFASEVNAQFFEWLHNCPRESACIECIVVFNRWTLEHKADATVGQIQAHSHFGIALVCAVAHTEPATYLRLRIEAVDVHAFVEVGFRSKFVHVLI